MAPSFVVDCEVHRETISEILSRVKTQLTSPTPTPVFVRSDTGLGKSTILIPQLAEWYIRSDRRVLVISYSHMTAESTTRQLREKLGESCQCTYNQRGKVESDKELALVQQNGVIVMTADKAIGLVGRLKKAWSFLLIIDDAEKWRNDVVALVAASRSPFVAFTPAQCPEIADAYGAARIDAPFPSCTPEFFKIPKGTRGPAEAIVSAIEGAIHDDHDMIHKTIVLIALPSRRMCHDAEALLRRSDIVRSRLELAGLGDEGIIFAHRDAGEDIGPIIESLNRGSKGPGIVLVTTFAAVGLNFQRPLDIFTTGTGTEVIEDPVTGIAVATIRTLDSEEFGQLIGRNRMTGPRPPRVYSIETPTDPPVHDCQFRQRLPGQVQLAARLLAGKTIKNVPELLRPPICSAVAALYLMDATSFEETKEDSLAGPFDCILNTAMRVLTGDEFLRFAFLYQAQSHPMLLKDSRDRTDFERKFKAWLVSDAADEILLIGDSIRPHRAQLSSMEEFVSRRLPLRVFKKISEERVVMNGRPVSMTIYSSAIEGIENRKVHVFGGVGLPTYCVPVSVALSRFGAQTILKARGIVEVGPPIFSRKVCPNLKSIDAFPYKTGRISDGVYPVRTQIMIDETSARSILQQMVQVIKDKLDRSQPVRLCNNGLLMGNRGTATALSDHCEVATSGLLMILANSADSDRLLSLLDDVIAGENPELCDHLTEMVLRAIHATEDEENEEKEEGGSDNDREESKLGR